MQLDDDAGQAVVSEMADGQLVTVTLNDSATFSPFLSCTTTYSPELIAKIFEFKGSAYLCDEILRDVDPGYVERNLRFDVLGYFTPEDFEGKRVLDFGCGSGASTMVLARMLPKTEIIGVELEANLLAIATDRAGEHGISDRVSFLASPDGDSLPPGLGQFDFVFLNAVFEHLLPTERAPVVSLLWEHLAPGGTLFVNQTPYRWFPMENHTTSIPLMNYLPKQLAGPIARRFSKRNLANDDWNSLLRQGIRGGSPSEILGLIKSAGGAGTLLEPNRFGLTNRIDLWLAKSEEYGHSAARQKMVVLFKVFKRLTRIEMLPLLSLAVLKQR